MIGYKRWWWWVAAICTVAILASIALSFIWFAGWMAPGCRCYVYLEHGMICGHPDAIFPGAICPSLPWYGHFQFRRSIVYEPWAQYATFDMSPGRWWFKFPLHLSLVVLVPIVVYPILPTVVRRRREKRGLCVKCEYDLTGNTSGVCPECGTERRPTAYFVRWSRPHAITAAAATVLITLFLTIGGPFDFLARVILATILGMISYRYVRRPLVVPTCCPKCGCDPRRDSGGA